MADRCPCRPILLIEDDPDRISQFRKWLSATGFALIEASSGGRALGILRKGMTDGIAGICLDHDLEKQPMTTADCRLSGSDLIVALIGSVPRTVPVLIHSMNTDKPLAMERRLRAAGFSVTRIRYTTLGKVAFDGWLEEVRDAWEDSHFD